ncbi:N-acetyltransferase [Treponema sp.]|uniref:GNAT family N-acetyltransferase n=1 Tax=Treponema sp. TaxID=166 RepID=UPI00298E92B2|nr:N-acetyltransferase [Treponema sp.]
MENYSIRVEDERDYSTVESLVRESFWNVYRPGCTEHYVLHHLRSNPDFIPELAFVMEADGKIIGQNVFVKAQITKDDGTAFPILTMGPICIANEYKRKGYGKILLDYSLEKAKALGYGAVCFEGNIDFYGKSGFDYASKFGIKYHGLPEGMAADFFLCKELQAGYLDVITGVYATPAAYFVAEENPEDFEKFEREFNLKNPLEKLKLPGQLV